MRNAFPGLEHDRTFCLNEERLEHARTFCLQRRKCGRALSVPPGNTKGGSITVLLTSCLTGLESAVWQETIQTSQTGGQWYSDTSPFSIPWFLIQSFSQSVWSVLY
jgi:hypothetical protein